ncbi:MAG: hypothetical protein GKR94_05785 [Gammaproteobacteria bacterium]|nr:hypothetical protein [Gammaproteobacteria bacterium]
MNMIVWGGKGAIAGVSLLLALMGLLTLATPLSVSLDMSLTHFDWESAAVLVSGLLGAVIGVIAAPRTPDAPQNPKTTLG